MGDTVIQNQLQECNTFMDEMLKLGWKQFGYVPWAEMGQVPVADDEEESEVARSCELESKIMMTHARGKGTMRGKPEQVAGALSMGPKMRLKSVMMAGSNGSLKKVVGKGKNTTDEGVEIKVCHIVFWGLLCAEQ